MGVSDSSKAGNIALVDPQKQTFKITPPLADCANIQSYLFEQAPACYWKDSKFVICGENFSGNAKNQLITAIVTLKDVDSESIIFNIILHILTFLKDPSANWYIVKDSPKMKKTQSYATHIYNDKLYLIRQAEESPDKNPDEIWCLDLSNIRVFSLASKSF